MTEKKDDKLREEKSLLHEQALQAATDEFVNDGCISAEEKQIFSHALALEICRRFFKRDE